MPRYVQIESGWNPNAVTGSYRGLLQMGSDEANQYGGYGLDAGSRMYAANYNWFKNQFGRDPNPTELYMAAQQGRGGLQQHLANPDAPAWQNMLATSEGQSKGAAWAKKAIWGNVPDSMKAQYGSVDNISSNDFINNIWKSKVEQTPSQALAFNGETARPDNGGLAAINAAMRGQPKMANDNSGMNWGNALGSFGGGLQDAGAWLLARDNPAGAAMLLAQANQRRLQNRPSFSKIGQDMFGQEQYGWVDPQSMRTFTIGADGKPNFALPGTQGGIGGTGGPAGNMSDLTNRIEAAKAAGTDPLNEVPKEVRSYVKSFIDGTAVPQNMSRGPLRDRLLDIAHMVDPNVNENTYVLRQQFAKNMGNSSPQSWGGQVNSANKILAHLDSAYSNLQELQNGPAGISDTLNVLNPAKMAYRSQSGDQAFLDAQSRFDTARKGIGDELEKLLSGSQGAEASKQYWLQRLDPRQGPTAVAGALDEARRLMMGQLGAIAHQKEMAYGTPTAPESLLSNDAQAAAQRVSGGRFNYENQTPASPRAATSPAAPSAPDAAQAAPAAAPSQPSQFKEGQTAVNKQTGKRIQFRNGQWQPI
jgi:hypothetical protein